MIFLHLIQLFSFSSFHYFWYFEQQELLNVHFIDSKKLSLFEFLVEFKILVWIAYPILLGFIRYNFQLFLNNFKFKQIFFKIIDIYYLKLKFEVNIFV
jgi:hypothetical protein